MFLSLIVRVCPVLSCSVRFRKVAHRFSGRFVSLNFRRHISVTQAVGISKDMSPQAETDKWDLKLMPDDLNSKVDSLIARCRKRYVSVAEVKKEDVNVENVLEVLNHVEGDFNSEFLYLVFPKFVSTNKELRSASAKAEIKLQEFNVEMSMREDIFERLVALQERQIDMDPEYKRYLEFLIKKGKRNGLHLAKLVQEEVKSLKNRINKLSSQFMTNLNEVTHFLEFTDKELDGLPSDFISELEKVPDSGKRKVTMKYPHYFPVMSKAKNPETRKRMLFAFNTQCMEENTRILEEIVSLRHKHAELLDFPNHASYATDICHAKTAENVSNFLTELAKKLQHLWQDEKKAMLEIKAKECQELNIPFDDQLNDYDLRYYSTKIEELHYNVDETELQQYFPLPYVTKKLLSIYQKLLGVTFTEVENAKTWHEDVSMFSVEDTSTGKHLGYFYLDLFPREGKYGHAALFPLQIPRLLPDGKYALSIAAMVANMTKPTSEKPSLLNHKEVTTFFHEFGHVMHQLCLNCSIAHFNNIEELYRDFIETPSQMLEEWCWEPSIIKELSCHYSENCPMPDDMIQALVKSRLANTAGFILRQIVLALFDQRIHTRKEADTKALYRDTQIEMLGITPMDGTNFAANFGHLINGYDAQYYGYLWSEVFSKDMYWTRFKDGNILNPAVGKEYKEKILEVGSSREVDDMLRDFIGREPNQNAFLLSRGLKVE